MTKKKTPKRDLPKKNFRYYWGLPFRFIADFFRELLDMENEDLEEIHPHQILITPHHAKDRLGQEGEKAGADFLLAQGYKILYRNYKFPSCEIDLIVQPPRSSVYVFVEVKTRSNTAYGAPCDSVDQRRINKILNASKEFIIWQHLKNPEIRFDVISILWRPNTTPQIEHLQNYFDKYGNVLM